MTIELYPELDVTDWEVLEFEPMGSKPNKRWLLEPGTAEAAQGDRVKWLFKPRTIQKDPGGAFPKGDDWAEKGVAPSQGPADQAARVGGCW